MQAAPEDHTPCAAQAQAQAHAHQQLVLRVEQAEPVDDQPVADSLFKHIYRMQTSTCRGRPASDLTVSMLHGVEHAEIPDSTIMLLAHVAMTSESPLLCSCSWPSRHDMADSALAGQ